MKKQGKYFNSKYFIANKMLMVTLAFRINMFLPGKHLVLMLIAPDMSAEEACQLK